MINEGCMLRSLSVLSSSFRFDNSNYNYTNTNSKKYQRFEQVMKKMLILAMSKFSSRVVTLPLHRIAGIFYALTISGGSLTPCVGCNGHTSPLMDLDDGKWAAVFFSPQVYKHQEMLTNNAIALRAADAMPMQVMDDLTVQVYPSIDFEYLMTTQDVAKGFGVAMCTIRRAKQKNPTELITGRHFLTGVTNCNARSGSTRTTCYTKAGIVRLGFFIKSARARLFRDWAEALILHHLESKQHQVKLLPAARNHNRLTPARMISLLADVCRIEDSALRNSIADKLMGREDVC